MNTKIQVFNKFYIERKKVLGFDHDFQGTVFLLVQGYLKGFLNVFEG